MKDSTNEFKYSFFFVINNKFWNENYTNPQKRKRKYKKNTDFYKKALVSVKFLVILFLFFSIVTNNNSNSNEYQRKLPKTQSNEIIINVNCTSNLSFEQFTSISLQYQIENANNTYFILSANNSLITYGKIYEISSNITFSLDTTAIGQLNLTLEIYDRNVNLTEDDIIAESQLVVFIVPDENFFSQQLPEIILFSSIVGLSSIVSLYGLKNLNSTIFRNIVQKIQRFFVKPNVKIKNTVKNLENSLSIHTKKELKELAKSYSYLSDQLNVNLDNIDDKEYWNNYKHMKL